MEQIVAKANKAELRIFLNGKLQELYKDLAAVAHTICPDKNDVKNYDIISREIVALEALLEVL